MSKRSIKKVHGNLLLIFVRGKTLNRAKTHRPSISAFSTILFSTKICTQSHSAEFLNWGDHVNSVPDLAARRFIEHSIIYTRCRIPRENKTANWFPDGPDTKCFVIFLDFHFNSNQRITGANQNSRLGIYNNTNFIL